MNGKCNITHFIHVLIEKYYIYNLSLFEISTYTKKKNYEKNKRYERERNQKRKR